MIKREKLNVSNKKVEQVVEQQETAERNMNTKKEQEQIRQKEQIEEKTVRRQRERTNQQLYIHCYTLWKKLQKICYRGG